MIAWSSTSTIRVGIGRDPGAGAAPALFTAVFPGAVAFMAAVLIAPPPSFSTAFVPPAAHGVGMSTCTCSPPSRARRKVSVPSSSRARAAMLTSPRCSPDGQATLAARRLRRTSSGRPQPSSEIVSRTRPPLYASRTTARVASACTAVLNSASPAIRNSDCSHSGDSGTGSPPMRTSTRSSSGMCTPESRRSIDGRSSSASPSPWCSA